MREEEVAGVVHQEEAGRGEGGVSTILRTSLSLIVDVC